MSESTEKAKDQKKTDSENNDIDKKPAAKKAPLKKDTASDAPAADTSPSPSSDAAAADTPPSSDKPGFSARATAAGDAVKRAACRTKEWSAGHLGPEQCDGLIVVRMMERFIERMRAAMAATPVDPVLDRLVHYGNLAALAAMALALVYGLLGAVRHVIFAPIPRAIGFVLLLAAFQYAANKFMGAGRHLMTSTPSRLSSTAFLNTVALVHAVAAVVFLVGGILLAVQQRSFAVMISALVIALVAYGIAFISLYPDRINVTVNPDVGAGEEALGILSFAVKLVVRLIPFVYGVGMIIGALALLGACLSRLGPLGYSQLGQQGSLLLLLAAAFPFAGYLFFVLYQLALDVLRSIIMLPGKLDALNARK